MIDVVISVAMCYYLRKSKGIESRLNSRISTLMVRVVVPFPCFPCVEILILSHAFSNIHSHVECLRAPALLRVSSRYVQALLARMLLT
jgi:hypothetical protein